MLTRPFLTAVSALLAFAGKAAVLHVGEGCPYARPRDAANEKKETK